MQTTLTTPKAPATDAAEQALRTAATPEPIRDVLAAAQALCPPEALAASWTPGRATGAGEWAIARAQLDAVYAIRAAWEADEDEDDDSAFPAGLRDAIESAEADLLAAEAPHWQAIADKVRLLLPFVDDDQWEPDWQPNPKGPSLANAFARALLSAELIGQSEPARTDALAAMLATEDLAHTAATDRSGYRNYAVNPGAVADMAAIIGAVQNDARDLIARPGFEGLGRAAIEAIWFPDDAGAT